MESLPSELKARVASFLCTIDLKSLRLVNNEYAAVAARPLFSVLRLSGRRQDEAPWLESETRAEHVTRLGHGRIKRFDFSELDDAVDEILSFSVERYMKTLIFDPAFYRERFWSDYRMVLEHEMHEPVTDVEFDDSDSDDDYEAAIQRVIEHRMTRPEREDKIISAAIVVWNTRMTQQKAKEASIVSALARLSKAASALDTIEIKPSEFCGYPGLESCNSYAIDAQRRDTFSSVFFLHIISQALLSAGRHIKTLKVSELLPEKVSADESVRHVFTGLENLRLGIIHMEALAEERNIATNLPTLLACARPTLKSLALVGGGKWIQLCARGEHSLQKICHSGDAETPLVFPELESLELGGLIMGTSNLIRFMQAQPKLKYLKLYYVHLATPGFGWPRLADELPESVKQWEVWGELRHEPQFPQHNADDPVAYNWMQVWRPPYLSDHPQWVVAESKDGDSTDDAWQETIIQRRVLI